MIKIGALANEQELSDTRQVGRWSIQKTKGQSLVSHTWRFKSDFNHSVLRV